MIEMKPRFSEERIFSPINFFLINFFHQPYHLPQLIVSPPSIPSCFSRHPYPHPFALFTPPSPVVFPDTHPQIEKSKQINNKFLQERLTKGTWRNLENERTRERERSLVFGTRERDSGLGFGYARAELKARGKGGQFWVIEKFIKRTTVHLCFLK